MQGRRNSLQRPVSVDTQASVSNGHDTARASSKKSQEARKRPLALGNKTGNRKNFVFSLP